MRMKFTPRRVVVAGAIALVVAGCGDLAVAPKSTTTSGNIFKDPASYRAFLAKLYAVLATEPLSRCS